MKIYLLTMHYYESNTFEVLKAYDQKDEALKQLRLEIKSMFQDMQEENHHTNLEETLQYLRDNYDTDISIQRTTITTTKG